MKLRTALLAATVLALPVAAKAQVSGPYVSLGVGYNILQNETLKNPGGSLSSNVQADGGFAGVGALGYGLGNGLRVEAQGAWYSNRMTQVGPGGSSAAGLTLKGNEQKPAAFINALYDIDLGLGFATPYVGVGGGYAWSQYKSLSAYQTVGLVSNTSYVNESRGSLAYQAILGAAFPIAGVPGLALTAEYRFMGVAQDRTYDSVNTTKNGGLPLVASNGSFKLGNDFNHSLMVGMRYAFNAAPEAAPAPAPAPVAVPQPAPSRTYLVFFDWDRADLTDRARQIIHEAADASTRVSYTAIKVNGYTDLSGTAAYNQRLSVRRAQSVASELVRDGVPRNAISIQGFGESNPLVPTAKGVREPQNRRVEIIIQ